jgi:hypothetical protein
VKPDNTPDDSVQWITVDNAARISGIEALAGILIGTESASTHDAVERPYFDAMSGRNKFFRCPGVDNHHHDQHP